MTRLTNEVPLRCMEVTQLILRLVMGRPYRIRHAALLRPRHPPDSPPARPGRDPRRSARRRRRRQGRLASLGMLDRVIVCLPREEGRPRQTLAAVAAALIAAGVEVESVVVPTGAGADAAPAFVHTPEPLIASFHHAAHLEEMTNAGDTVLVSDHDGLGGLFALKQAMRPVACRRRVIVAAGDSRLLLYQAIAGTFAGLDADATSAVDWELVAYRFADAVLTLSPWAVRTLGDLGLSAQLAAAPVSEEVGASLPPGARVWLPEPPSRRSQFAAVLRALHAWGRVGEVWVSPHDEPDLIWGGTAWDAAVAERAGLTLQRKAPPGPVDVIILGDRTSPPPAGVREAWKGGVAILGAAGSPATVLFPGTWDWQDEFELAARLGGEGAPAPARAERKVTPLVLSPRAEDPGRARRVSVGIPVFRNVRHLDDCLESLQAQTQPPAEVLLYDDGSADAAVTEALRRWDEDWDIVRVMTGANAGVCVARNNMLEAMEGDSFLLVDADDVLATDFIERCATGLRLNPDLAAVSAWTRFFGIYEGTEAKAPFDARTALLENPIISTCAVVDMAIRERGIRFEPDLAWIYCEDWDFWAQIVAAGGSFGLVPEVLVYHRTHPEGGGTRRTELAYDLGRARATRRFQADTNSE